MILFVIQLQQLSNATIGGNLIIPIGSSSAPSLHFAGDSTTGIYRNAAVTLSITSNSTETARFNYSQIQFFAPLAMGSNTINCGAITLSGANTNSMPYFDSAKELKSTQLTNGQLMIGSTGNAPVAATLTGTSNRVIVTNGSGSITLSTPQDINTNSAVRFGSMTTGGNVYINQTAAATNGSGRLQITGTAAITGNTPSILCSITADTYPLFNLMPYNHNDIQLLFDCWRMPSFEWYSSSATANWRLAKTSGAFVLSYATGVPTEGDQITSFELMDGQ